MLFRSEQLGKIKRGIWKKKGVEYIRITDRLDAEGMRKIHGYHSVEKVWRKASDEGDEVEKRLREYRDEIIRVDWEENQSEQVQVNVDTKGEEMQIEEVKKDVIKKKEITKDAITKEGNKKQESEKKEAAIKSEQSEEIEDQESSSDEEQEIKKFKKSKSIDKRGEVYRAIVFSSSLIGHVNIVFILKVIFVFLGNS